MTQDFAKKKRASAKTKSGSKAAPRKRNNKRRKPQNKQKAPAWAWLTIGLLLATLITLLIYLANRPDVSTQTASTTKAKPETPSKPPQPRFDFYQILKEQKVEVPDRSSEIQASTPANVRYYLQAGSFRNLDDAETLRAELLLINLPTNIEGKTSDSGKRWHRVIVGPFKSRSKMAKARSILASKQLSPLLLKRSTEQ